MVLNEAVKKILRDSNRSQTEVAKELGYAYTSGLNQQLRNNNLSVRVLLRILDVVGYELVLRPKSGTNKAERTVVVDKAGKDE